MNKKIYVVGGGPDYVRQLHARLVADGFAFTHYDDAERARLRCEQSLPDAIIVDKAALENFEVLGARGVAVIGMSSLENEIYDDYPRIIAAAIEAAQQSRRAAVRC